MVCLRVFEDIKYIKRENNMRLKGTGLMLATLIIQILVMVVILFIYPTLAAFMLIDLALIIFTYNGFKNGKIGWATFAIIYGIIILVLGFANGTVNISGVLMTLAGILAHADN